MKHYTVWYLCRLGKIHKMTVLAESLEQTVELFNSSRRILGARRGLLIHRKIFERR